jgi:nitroimidazol reductase NimA-like FMN-containing flavoprotein (pyridoxamine 5'-phosphate oxidase superfamily)
MMLHRRNRMRVTETERRDRNLHDVRRKDRAVEDDAWIRDLLARAPMGTLATARDGQPFVNSNLFAYAPDEQAIFMHTARTGRTRENVEREERVCFTATEMGRLLPAATAFEMSVEYNGAVVFGRARALLGSTEKRAGLERLLSKYFPHLRYGEDYAAMTEDELSRTTVYRIDIDAWSGKQKRVADDFPGAFRYGERPIDGGNL